MASMLGVGVAVIRPSSTTAPTSASSSRAQAVLDVLKHGRLVLANPKGAGDPPLQRYPEMDAELLADHLRLLHHPGRQLSARRELANVDQGRMAKRTDRIEADVAPELEPDLGADVADHRRLESRLAE